jgi:hypothetical protein
MTVGERGFRGLTGEVYAHSVSLYVNKQKYLEIMPIYYRKLFRQLCLNKKGR